MKFEKTIKVEKDKITIEVSCPKQVYSSTPRIIFRENIEDLIPEEYKEKVEMTRSPAKLVSNIPRKKYTNVGVWEFSIKKKEPTRKPQTTTRRRKQATKTEKKTEIE